jgi:hypothetical protein
MKKILWKSDFRSFTVLYGTMTLLFAIVAVMHLLDDHPSDAFGEIIATCLPLILTLYLAFTDSDRITMSMLPEAFERAKQEAYRNSFLNWENIPPNKRNPPPDMIG